MEKRWASRSQTTKAVGRCRFSGSKPHRLQPPIFDVEKHIEIMDQGQVGLATLEANTNSLGYRLNGEPRGRLVQSLQRLHPVVGKARPDRFIGMAVVPLQDADARGESIGARHRRSQISRRFHRHQRQWPVLQRHRLRSVLGQGARARRHDRHAPRAYRRRRAHDRIRFERRLRQSRRLDLVAGLHALQRPVRPFSQSKNLRPARRRLSAVSSRPLRQRVHHRPENSPGTGEETAQRLS